MVRSQPYLVQGNQALRFCGLFLVTSNTSILFAKIRSIVDWIAPPAQATDLKCQFAPAQDVQFGTVQGT